MTLPTDFPVICIECKATIGEDYLVAHMRWHEEESNLKIMAHAHEANLIERMHVAEKQIEAAVARIWLLERSVRGLPFTGDPQSHHHQME